MDSPRHAFLSAAVEDDRVIWQSSQCDIRNIIHKLGHRESGSAQCIPALSPTSAVTSTAASSILTPLSHAPIARPMKRRRPTRTGSIASTAEGNPASCVPTVAEDLLPAPDPDLLLGMIRGAVEARTRKAALNKAPDGDRGSALGDRTNVMASGSKSRVKGKAAVRSGVKRGPPMRTACRGIEEEGSVEDTLRSPPRTRARTAAMAMSPLRTRSSRHTRSSQLSQSAPPRSPPSTGIPCQGTQVSAPGDCPPPEEVVAVAPSLAPAPAPVPLLESEPAFAPSPLQQPASPPRPTRGPPANPPIPTQQPIPLPSQVPASHAKPRRAALGMHLPTRTRPPVPPFPASKPRTSPLATKPTPVTSTTPKAASSGGGGARGRYKIPSFKPPAPAPGPPAPAPALQGPTGKRVTAERSFSSGDGSFDGISLGGIDMAELESACRMYDA